MLPNSKGPTGSTFMGQGERFWIKMVTKELMNDLNITDDDVTEDDVKRIYLPMLDPRSNFLLRSFKKRSNENDWFRIY